MTHLLGNFMKRFFSHYLPVQKGLSANTIAAYRDAVKLLLCYAADTLRKPVDKLAVEDITEKVVLGFLDYVQQVRRCSSRTRNARLAAIHSLFAFIAREEPELLAQCQRIRAIPLKRTEHITVGYLEEKEMQAILDSVQINSRSGIRDRALLLLLYNTGARVSEIAQLKLCDLRLDGTGQVNLLGKGRCHGYEMVQSLKQITALRIREGNIYPILARLQTDGLATCHQEPSRDGPPRKYYELTKLGQETVAQMNSRWDELTQSMQTIRKGSQV